MTSTLTGTDAARAIQLYAELGARNSRFDADKVARSIISVRGRLRLTAALRLAQKRLPAPGFSVWVRLRPGHPGTGPHRVKSRAKPSAASAPPRPSPDDPYAVEARLTRSRGLCG